MKLRNKKTGEINDVDLKSITYPDSPQGIPEYKLHHSLAELNAEWEDYEEPKGMQWVDVLGANDGRVVIQYSNEEEAELAVRKLKAWKRLKDKGFRFTGFTHKDRGRLDELEIYCQLGERPEDIEDMEDVCLLFGGEE